ncbi:glycerophosphodiester phosphodiesterase [Pseudoalteromonas gelatinilytica]|uniref:Glycerophosphodiester phosphodiesterase n=1 Tax=Pseudoalteromonas gelatinilytica TaxID=1703256 RepID=A0A3A3EQ34_9GAMM|nr:glycerophosphodiester phosphodiesterase family protein [Pseudoalteromonas profundi]RJF35826.1 glycerophosphodiester phosphodiesterase [Pseudoalteromonas profundi]
MMQTLSQKPWLLACIFLCCIGLTACKSTPESSAENTLTVAEKNAIKAKQDALRARGFYESQLGNINYLLTRQCSNFNLQSHRGSIRYAENSLNAVIDAIDNNFDVVEIDVRITRDDVWVVHHDARTGRETGTVDNQRRKIESMSYKKEWGYLRHRNQDTGLLTDDMPPSFRELAATFARYRKPHQKLNIEIKSNASVNDLKMLDYLAYEFVGGGNYFFSSLEMRNLTRMRDINPDIYLAFIQSPAKASMNKLASDLKRGAGSDPIYERNKEELESLQALGNRHHREKRYDSPVKLDKLAKQLKRNFGYVLDIRHYTQSAARLKPVAKARGIMIATYSINGHDYHERSLLAQSLSLRPDSVIMDDTVYGFCSVFELPKMQPFFSDEADAKLIASMPADLDLERLDELYAYKGNQLYPAVGGTLKSTQAQTYIPKVTSTPSAPNLEIGTRQADEDFSLETDPAVELELRKKQ